MSTARRPSMLDMTRTTTIIGELIQLITEIEDVTTALGKEGHAYYKAGLFYDELTLELCRRVDSATQVYEKSNRDLQEGLDDGFLQREKPGPFTRLRKSVIGNLMHRETLAYERTLNDSYNELTVRIRSMANQDPRSLSAKMLKMCTALKRLEGEVEARWDELESRTKDQRKGTMFVLVLNQFLFNFFRFANQQWLRHWIARMQTFQERIGERIHREVVLDLSVDDEAAANMPSVTRGGASRTAPASPARSAPAPSPVDLGADDVPTAPARPAVFQTRTPEEAPPSPPPAPAAIHLDADDDDPAAATPPRPSIFGADRPAAGTPPRPTAAPPPAAPRPARLPLFDSDTPPASPPPPRPPLFDRETPPPAPAARPSLFESEAPPAPTPSLFDPPAPAPSLFDPPAPAPSLFDPPAPAPSLFDPPAPPRPAVPQVEQGEAPTVGRPQIIPRPQRRPGPLSIPKSTDIPPPRRARDFDSDDTSPTS